MFTDADNFGLSFPLDLDVNVKASLLAATFLIVLSFSTCILSFPWTWNLVSSDL